MLRFFTEVRAYWPVCGATRAILWALWIPRRWKYHCKLSNLWDILLYHKRSLSGFLLFTCLGKALFSSPSNLASLLLRTEGNALSNLVQIRTNTTKCLTAPILSLVWGKKAVCLPASFPFTMRNGCCRRDEVKMFFSDPHIGLLALTCGLRHLLPRQPSKACSHHHPFLVFPESRY